MPLAEDMLRRGKKVGFPISHPQTRTLTFHSVTDLSAMERGVYGIPEPSPSGELLNQAKESLCLVPALAADRHGFRLGYGGGYYDRFLTEFLGDSLLPLYHCLITDSLPTDPTDHAVAYILTEKGEESLHASTQS